jgi:hypothetical protein
MTLETSGSGTLALLEAFCPLPMMPKCGVEAMPRFFFSAVTPRGSATDLVGNVCRNAREAKERARQTAADLARAQLRDGTCPSGWVEVSDEEHRPLFLLPLRSIAS